jgi:hypothetical protein
MEQLSRWLPRILLLLGVMLVIIGACLPNTSLAYLRSEFRWLGQPLNWIDNRSGDIDLTHVLLFMLLGMMAYWALHRLSMPVFVGLMVGFAALSELVQFWAPGRRPTTGDFVDDLLGLSIGVICAWLLGRLWRFGLCQGRRALNR